MAGNGKHYHVKYVGISQKRGDKCCNEEEDFVSLIFIYRTLVCMFPLAKREAVLRVYRKESSFMATVDELGTCFVID